MIGWIYIVASGCFADIVGILHKQTFWKYSLPIQFFIFKQLGDPLFIGISQFQEILGQGDRHWRDIVPVDIGLESAVGIPAGISHILAFHGIILNIQKHIPEGPDRISGQFYNKTGEPFIPERTGPVHHTVIPPGKLGLDELHDAGYGFAVFRGFYAEMEVVIHDRIGDQVEFVSFQGLVEHVVHQVLDLF